MAKYLFSGSLGGSADDRSAFTRDEFVRALSLIVPAGEAETWADEILAQPAQDAHGNVQLSDDVLDLLSLLSEECAARVGRVTGFSASVLAARQQRLKRRLGLT